MWPLISSILSKDLHSSSSSIPLSSLPLILRSVSFLFLYIVSIYFTNFQMAFLILLLKIVRESSTTWKTVKRTRNAEGICVQGSWWISKVCSHSLFITCLLLGGILIRNNMLPAILDNNFALTWHHMGG